jgi:hypothetical protein
MSKTAPAAISDFVSGPVRMYNVTANGVRLGRGDVAHIARHGISPEECEEAYRNGPVVIEVQERKRERRWLCLGETNAAR